MPLVYLPGDQVGALEVGALEVTASWIWVHNSSVFCFVFSVFSESSAI